MSIFQDQSVSLNFIDAYTNSNITTRYRKAKVRVDSVVDNLLKYTTPSEIPYPLIMFLDQMTSHDAYIANNFLTKFELDRIKLGKYGQLQEPTDEIKEMLIGFFLLGKIFVSAIMLKPQSIGVNVKIKDLTLTNFKVVASIVWHAFLQYIKLHAKPLDPEDANDFIMKKGVKYRKKPTDLISEDLFDERDLSHVFNRDKKWLGILSVKLGKFTKAAVAL